jgi:predicted Fe-S protein YdhL (DUF1289 family)
VRYEISIPSEIEDRMQSTPPKDIKPAQGSSARHSPCVGVCQIDQATGWCLGCGRTGEEIGRWPGLTDTDRLALWEELPGRLDKLAVQARLMPWNRAELAEWINATLTEKSGAWVTGVPGAVAEFPAGAGRNLEVSVTDEEIIARAADARFRVRLHDKLRAFTFGNDGPIVLALPKARAALPVVETLTSLGPDTDAIDLENREHALFDFGVGRKTSRFCVRTHDEELREALMALSGEGWPRVMHDAGMLILAKSPNRVVETALARIEVFARIPAPGGRSPDGAHTHFLPSYLQSGDEAPAGLSVPEFALSIAIYYPRKSN